jgi:hypothetical protein
VNVDRSDQRAADEVQRLVGEEHLAGSLASHSNHMALPQPEAEIAGFRLGRGTFPPIPGLPVSAGQPR